MREKWFVKSKTLWGAIIAALPGLLAVAGVQLPVDPDTLLSAGMDLLDALNEVAGLVLLIIGRYDAPNTRLTLMPPRAYITESE